ncbi:MAG: hypothetical protein JNL98_05460 [Bryobacterales bacterium]|nr:hypothetical protein [Bryobacterales bacterium]
MSEHDKPGTNGSAGPDPGGQDVRALAGGFSAGNLTSEEQRRLIEAALERQDLFDELMAEEPLREVFEDPRARAEIVEALQTPPSTIERIKLWWKRPWAWGAVGALTTACLVVAFFGTRPTSQLAPPAMQEAASRVPIAGPPMTSDSTMSYRVQPKAQPASPSAAAAKEEPEARVQARPAVAVREQAGLSRESRKDVAAEPVKIAEPAASEPVPAAPPPAPSVVAGARVREERDELQRPASRDEAKPVETGTAETKRLASNVEQAKSGAKRESDVRMAMTDASATGAAAPASRAKVVAAKKSPAAPVAMLLRRLPDGSLTPVSSGQALVRTDALQFRMNPPVPGWVTVERRGESGRVETLVTRQRVEVGTQALIPSDGAIMAEVGPQTLLLRFVPDDRSAIALGGMVQQSFRQMPIAPGGGAVGGGARTEEAAKGRKTASEDAAEKSNEAAVMYEIRVVGRPQ